MDKDSGPQQPINDSLTVFDATRPKETNNRLPISQCMTNEQRTGSSHVLQAPSSHLHERKLDNDKCISSPSNLHDGSLRLVHERYEILKVLQSIFNTVPCPNASLLGYHGFHRKEILKVIERGERWKRPADKKTIIFYLHKYHKISSSDTEICLRYLLESEDIIAVNNRGNVYYRNSKTAGVLKGVKLNNPLISQCLSGVLRYLNDTEGSKENEGFHHSQIEEALKSFLASKMSDGKNCQFHLPTELIAENLLLTLDKEVKFGKLGRLPNGLYVLDEDGIYKQQSEVPLKPRKIGKKRTLPPGLTAPTFNRCERRLEILQRLQVIYTSAENPNKVYLTQNNLHRDEIFEAIEKCPEPVEPYKIIHYVHTHFNIPASDTEFCLCRLHELEDIIAIYFRGTVRYRDPRKPRSFWGEMLNNPILSQCIIDVLRSLTNSEDSKYKGLHPTQITSAIKLVLNSILDDIEDFENYLPPEFVGKGLLVALAKEAKYGKIHRLPNGLYVLDESGIYKKRDRKQ
nr:histone acetyltransferase myst3 [Hymenolepis microstoma]